MKSLYFRIWLTVVAALALFALVSGALVQRHLEAQRERVEGAARERAQAWGDLLERSLPPASATPDEQLAAMREWSQRLRLPMALDDARGQRLGVSDSFIRRNLQDPDMQQRLRAIRLDDGRTLWVPLPNANRGLQGPGGGGLRPWWAGPRTWPDGLGLAVLLLVMFLAVAAGAWPVVRRLTRRLEALKQGVEAFGAGALHQRVAEEGKDEVAALATSFNHAATRIEALLRSHQTLLANASHELRSPLARLKMAVAMLDGAPAAQQARLKQEIDTNIVELDALVEEVLLASRLDSAAALDLSSPVALLPLAAEEAARVGAVASGDDVQVVGEERLLRRALRNLLENAKRYGDGDIEVIVQRHGPRVQLGVCDRGTGVPEAMRERIFEPFFRLPGHAEREGGVGLGLSLVRQIAQRHGGQVRCLPRVGGGQLFRDRTAGAVTRGSAGCQQGRGRRIDLAQLLDEVLLPASAF